MRILIIANPLVGIQADKRTFIEDITALLKKRGDEVDITYTMKPGMGSQRSSHACVEGYDAVYAAGGDGTVNDVASGLIGEQLPLGIIPLGTGNGFARGLGIPLDHEGIIATLTKNNIVPIDTGLIAGHSFLSTAGLGYDASIAHDFDARKGAKRSRLRYFLLAIKNYFFTSSEHLSLTVDGREMKRTVFALTFCNTSQYGSGAVIAPQADPQSGSLIAALIPKFPLYKAFYAIKKLFDGTVAELQEVEHFTFKSLKIKRSKPGIIHVDGETFSASTTLNVAVKPGSLNVILP